MSFSTGLPDRLPVGSLDEMLGYAQSHANGFYMGIRCRYTNEVGAVGWNIPVFERPATFEWSRPYDWPAFFKIAVGIYLRNGDVLSFLKSQNPEAPGGQIFRLDIGFADISPYSSSSEKFLEGHYTFRLQKSGDDYIVPDSENDMSLLTFDTFRVKSAAPVSSAHWGGTLVSTNGQTITVYGDIFDVKTHDGGSLVEISWWLYRTPGLSGRIMVIYESGMIEYFRIPEGTKIVADQLRVRLEPRTDKLRLSVEGRSATGSMVIESSSDLVTWESFSTITNYSGLAWTEILAKAPQRFYRARGP